MLVYFAAKWEIPMATWTAISRSPSLTALAVWPKGNAWGGGGLFHGPKVVGLNYDEIAAPVMKTKSRAWHPLPAHDSMPKGMTVAPVAAWAGRGEDNPIQHERMTRDEWGLVQNGKAHDDNRKAALKWTMQDPEIYERASPNQQFRAIRLRRLLRGVGMRDGHWNVEDFEVAQSDGTVLRLIENCGWADWLSNGDLAFAIDGCLYRLAANAACEPADDPRAGATLIAELTSHRFQSLKPPTDKLNWP